MPEETNPTDTLDRATFGGGEHFADMEENVETVSEHPEPETAEPAETEEVEAAPETEVEAEETPETEEATEEVQEEDTGDNWLPDEQAKQFPLETLVEFSNRRKTGYTDEEIRESPRLQKLLAEKLNTDIHAANQARELAALRANKGPEEETNPFAEEIKEVEKQAAKTEATPSDPQADHYARVEKFVSALPKDNLQKWGETILKKYGVNTDVPALQKMLANPALTPEQRADVTGAIQLAQGASELALEQARGVVDVVLTMMPAVLPQLLEQIYPGTAERAQRMQEVEDVRAAWTTVSQLKGQDGKPQFGKLPAFGSEQMQSLVVETERQLGLPAGGLGGMKFNGSNGQPLNQRQTAEMVYRMVAKVAVGQKPTVPTKHLQVAVQTGRKLERDHKQKVDQGRAMASGTSSRGFEKAETGDAARDMLRRVIEEDEAESQPFSHKKWQTQDV